jgi:hypothetical protein
MTHGEAPRLLSATTPRASAGTPRRCPPHAPDASSTSTMIEELATEQSKELDRVLLAVHDPYAPDGLAARSFRRAFALLRSQENCVRHFSVLVTQ